MAQNVDAMGNHVEAPSEEPSLKDNVIEVPGSRPEDRSKPGPINTALTRVSGISDSSIDPKHLTNEDHSYTSETSPHDEPEILLCPIDLQGVEELTGVGQIDGLAMAGEYEVHRLKIGPVHSTVNAPDRRPAETLSQARSLFILEQESHEIDHNPKGLPRIARLAIQNHDEVERSRITRAYLHKYRSDFDFLAHLHSLALNEKVELANEKGGLTKENESLKRNFVMLKDEFMKKDDENYTLQRQLIDADRDRQDLEAAVIAAEKEIILFTKHQIPEWQAIRARYMKELIDAKRREAEARRGEEKARVGEVKWRKLAEKNKSLAQAERRRRKQIKLGAGTQTDQDTEPSPENPVIQKLEIRLAKLTDENQRYAALLHQLKDYYDAAGGQRSVSSTASSSPTGSTRPASRPGTASSPLTLLFAVPHLPGAVQRVVDSSLPKAWQQREQDIQDSDAFKHNLTTLRWKRAGEHEMVAEYERLQNNAYATLHDVSRPYVSRDERVTQLNAIVGDLSSRYRTAGK